jgi:hypothetical protein
LDAILASSQAQQKADDLKDKIVVAKDKLKREENYVNAMFDALTFVTPIDGKVIALIVDGSFVKKGTTVAEIKT